MTSHARARLYVAAALISIAATATAQVPDPTAGEAINTPAVTNAPFSGEAVVTVRATIGDGTQIVTSITEQIYRDSAGRIRRQQIRVGDEQLAANDFRAIITVVDPVAGVLSQLNPATREAYQVPLATLRGNWKVLTSSPAGSVEYRVTTLSRTEPSRELFAAPAGYAIQTVPRP